MVVKFPCLSLQVFDWYDQVGDSYLKRSQLGDNLHAAQMLQEEHVRFEMHARVSTSHSDNSASSSSYDNI